jgi:hypothetical protein
MESQIGRTNSPKRMTKQERKRYIEKMDRELSNLLYKDKIKMDFSRKYVNDLLIYKAQDGDEIQIGPIDKRLLEYFIFSILIDFEKTAFSAT